MQFEKRRPQTITITNLAVVSLQLCKFYLQDKQLFRSNINIALRFLTGWERHNSAPYLRLKNSKRTSKCQKTQSIKLTKKVSKHFRKTQTTELARQGPFWIFQHPLLQNIEKLKGDTLGKIVFRKTSSNAEKN